MVTKLLRTLVLALGCVAALDGGASASDPRTIGLVDQDGSPFRLIDLAGRPTLVTFVASRCTDACPIANAAFYQLERRMRSEHLNVRLVTITLDPVYDTPYVMSSVARRFRARPSDWRFASGRVADVQRLMASLKVVAQPDARGIPEVHSTYVYLLDSKVRLTNTLLLSSNLSSVVVDLLRKPARRAA